MSGPTHQRVAGGFDKTVPSTPSEPIFNSSLLAGISQENLEKILSAAENRQITRKQIIVNAGDAGEHLFLLRRGHARYYRTTKQGDEIVLRWLVPGDTFGLRTLLKNPPSYVGSAEALSNGEVLVWTHAKVQKLAALYPQLEENALRILLQYLRNYADRHIRLVSKSAEERLADVLLILEHKQGQVHGSGVELEITNEQLSALADISRFTTSRLLSKWHRKGIISKQRAKVVIRTPEYLVMD